MDCMTGRRALVFLATVTLVGVGVALWDASKTKLPATESAYRSESREALLSELGRRLVNAQMRRHRANMIELFALAVELDFDAVERIAREIVAEPTFAAAQDQDATSFNAQLPSAFLEAQKRMRTLAGSLAESAAQKDSAALGKSYGALIEQCVACHGLFARKEVLRNEDLQER